MKRRPMLAFAIILCAAAAVLHHLEVAPEAALIIALIGTGMLVVLPLLRSGSVLRILAAVVVAAWSWWRVDLPPSKSEPVQFNEGRCRVEGVVERATSRPWGSRYVIRGEVDAVGAPACSTAVIATVYGGRTVEEGSEVVLAGRCRPPTIAAYPELFDEAAWLRGRHAALVVRTSDTAVCVMRDPPLVANVLSSITEWGSSVLHAYLEPIPASIAEAMVLGMEQSIDPETREDFARTGTAHMLAVSGTHVALITGLLLAVAGGSVRSWWAFTCLILLVIGYVMLTGADPPAVRAAAVFGSYTVGRLFQREPDPLNLLGAVAVAEVLLWPSMLVSPSFQLSLAATYCILVLMPRWMSCFKRCTAEPRRWKSTFYSMASLNLAASAGVALPSALIFGQVALLSPLVNFVVVPILTGAMLASIGILIAHPLISFLAPALAWCAGTAMHLALTVIKAASSIINAQPERLAPILAVAAISALLWPSVSSSWRGLATRFVLAASVLGLIMVIAAQEPSTVTLKASGSSVVLRVHDHNRSRIVQLYERYGRTCVRSLHDPHPPP